MWWRRGWGWLNDECLITAQGYDERDGYTMNTGRESSDSETKSNDEDDFGAGAHSPSHHPALMQWQHASGPHDES
ncbi:hypothetical protein AVEN_116785-1 [Araneus ventricosus]|uniref:Uncharacterized protein n=1 Tax=Araneus ventricosus TaxID=182803 RepID=A0A4Y2D9U7_ARAVE|nr:hypothetical protein AVEN_116785-1 [Araneus ventricosus]